MSSKGGLDREKHGGAHQATHENGIDVNIDINDSFQIKNEFLEVGDRTQTNHSIQDGGERIDGKIVTSENLNFLSTDDLDSYERAVVENNTEWLKSRCRNLENVDFADIPSGSSDGVGDLFGNDPLPDDTGLPLCTDASSLANEIQLLAKTVPQNSNIVIPALDNTVLGNQSRRDSLDELAEAVEGDIQIENKTLQSLGINGDKNNTLMTPQELESMPDRGLEFEESVGPKTETSTGQIISLDQVDTDQSLENVCQQESTGSVLKTDQVIRIEPDGQIAPLLDIINGTQTEQVPTNLIVGDSIMPDQGNLKLATISISTDKISNSTQILVNTSQGQQLYHINTADLAQATTAIEPLSRNQKTTESQIKTIQTFENLPAGTQTGYLILPASQAELLSNGILMSMPVGAIGGNVIPQNVDGAEVPGIPRKVYLCSEPGCDKVFKKLSKFKIHQMQHTGERPFKCSKDGCDWAFTTLYKLKRHEESHEGRKDYICEVEGCGKKFTTVYNLNSHKKLHERPCTEMCTEPGCGEKFPTKRQLDLHMKNHSGQEKTYKCPVEGCDKTFFSPHCMGSHPRVHQQEREDLTCKFEGCGKVFDKICRLKQHTRSHTGEKPYVCEFEGCGWAFTTASKLKRHQAKHTGFRKWSCEQCGKAFMRSEHLKGHMITHSGVKPYACPVEGCSVKFTAKSSLYVHMKKHDSSGEKITYHCPMEGCEKKYSNKITLRQHLVKQHLSSGNGTADLSHNIDILPFLVGDMSEVEQLVNKAPTDVQPTTDTNVTTAHQMETSKQQVDPLEDLIVSAAGVTDPALMSSDSVEINQAMISQLLTSVESRSTVSIDTNTVQTPIVNTTENVPTALVAGQNAVSILPTNISNSSKNTNNSKTLPSPVLDADSGIVTRVVQENWSGSARTDYRSNHMSEKARKRQQMLKENALPTVNLDSSSFQDPSEENFMVPTSAITFSPPENMMSRGITFRDPETGVLYVQTQLLQDDPPNPDLYSDENGITSDLSSLNDSVGSDHSLNDIEFTGSTINLQDLA